MRNKRKGNTPEIAVYSKTTNRVPPRGLTIIYVLYIYITSLWLINFEGRSSPFFFDYLFTNRTMSNMRLFSIARPAQPILDQVTDREASSPETSEDAQ